MRVISRSVALVLCLSGSGCAVRVLAPSESDPIRDRVRELEENSRRLKAENEELRATLEQQAATSAAVNPEVLANAPVAVQLRGSFGSAVRRDTPPGDVDLVVHVEPLDSRARFVQLTGWFDMTVVAFNDGRLDADGAAEVLATRHFEPAAVRDSLRSGLFGIYYALECPLPAASVSGRTQVVARIAFRDGFTDRRLETIVQCPLSTPTR
jgi:hypothetical protein